MTTLRDALATLTRVRKPARRQEEHGLQAATIELLELVLPSEAIVTSIDHANAGSRVTGALLKARGVKAGIPDIWIIWAKPGTAPRQPVLVALETKATKGRLSKPQEIWRDALRLLGVHWAAPRTIEAAIDAITEAGIPVRRHQL